MAYLGNQPSNNFVSLKRQVITGDGTTSYTLDHSVASVNDVAIFVNNVRQDPASYSISGTALTLGGTISSSDSCYVIFLGQALQTVTPATGTVTNAMIASNAGIATTKLGAGAIIQVVNDSDTTNTVVSTQTYTDTGLSASITPNSTSSKIFMIISQDFQLENTTATSSIIGGFKLLRDSTTLYTGSDDGNSFGVRHFGNGANNRGLNFVWSYSFFDTPSSTSSITYKTQCRTFDTNHRFRLNNQINGISKSFITLISIVTGKQN